MNKLQDISETLVDVDMDIHPACESRMCQENPRPASYVIRIKEHYSHVWSSRQPGTIRLSCSECYEGFAANAPQECVCGEPVRVKDLLDIVNRLS